MLTAAAIGLTSLPLYRSETSAAADCMDMPNGAMLRNLWLANPVEDRFAVTDRTVRVSPLNS